MMKRLTLSSIVILTATFSLASFGATESATEEQPEEASPSSKELCTEVMELNAKQLGSDEAETKRFVGACSGTSQYTPADWQCVLKAMQQGDTYVKATDACFPKG
jgi:hypothetical protein